MKTKQLAWVDRETDPERPKLVMYAPGAIPEHLENYKHGQKVWVSIEKYYRKRSKDQNSLFHVYCQEIADETGQDLDTVKSTIKTMYCKVPLLNNKGEQIVDENTGEYLEYVKETSAMDTVEMGTLIDQTIIFAQEFFGIILNLPGESQELKFK